MVMLSRYKYLFGPVASRRLGLSLGVDIVPFKTCTYNCVYCECGPTTKLITERQSWYEREEVLDEIKDFLQRKIFADFITFSGSGEPTLNKDIGWLIQEIKKLTPIRVAVLTNGSLLWQSDVRADLMAADVVIPSLDAVSEEVFKRVNLPAQHLKIETIIEGIIKFREEFKGELWLEILFCQSINDSEDEVQRLVSVVKRIQPHKIQLGTVVRPPAQESIKPVTASFLKRVVRLFGDRAEIIGYPPSKQEQKTSMVSDDAILNLLQRRPTTASELSRAFNVPLSELSKQLFKLERSGKIQAYEFDSKTFYKTTSLQTKSEQQK